MLELKNVETYYGAIHALKGVSLDVPKGGVVTLIGANGAGKSTTLMSVCGIVPIKSGEIRFMGELIHKRSAEDIVAMGIVQVPEGRRIFPRMTVRENLEMGAYLRRDEAGIKSDLERALTLFPRLQERLGQAGGTLSGGEQQMLAVGRALMARPKLLLLDEPSLGLAPQVIHAIFAVLRELNKEGVTIFLVEQNVHIALDLATRGFVLETGAIVLADTPQNLLNNPDIRKAYLGEE